MEDCVLSIIPPGLSDTFDPLLSFNSGSLVEVWLLDRSEELLPHISWGYGPARSRKLMSITFETDMNATSDPFDCPSGAFSTFEITCASPSHNCSVDFWQTRAIHSGTNTFA
jgi:hypothetical protein